MGVFLCGLGTAVGTTHSGIFVVRNIENLGFKGIVPCMQSGVLAMYGIAISIILALKMNDEISSVETGYRYMSAGLIVGLTNLASGWGIGSFMKMMNEKPQDTIVPTPTHSTTTTEQTPLLGENQPSIFSNKFYQ